MKKQVLILIGLLTIFICLSFPNRNGSSVYAYAELLRDLHVLHGMAQGQIALLGPPSSLGAYYFGPAYYYLLFPIVWLSGFSVWSMPLASLVYGCVTIILTYYIVRRWWGNENLALLAAGLMATSSLSFQFAKYESNPNQVPLFSLLFFFALERLIGGSNHRLLFALLLGTAFGIAIQLHAVPLICLPVIVLLVIVRKQIHLAWQHWAAALAAAIAVMSPYVYYELTHQFSNVRALLTIGAGPRQYVPWLQQALDYLGFWISSFLSTNTFFNPVLILGWPACSVLVALFGGWLLLFIYDRHRLRPRATELRADPSVRAVLGYWFWVPTIVLLLPIGALTGLRIYYYFILSPLVFMMLALGLARLWKLGFIRVVWYTLAAFLLLQIGQTVLYNRIVSSLR